LWIRSCQHLYPSHLRVDRTAAGRTHNWSFPWLVSCPILDHELCSPTSVDEQAGACSWLFRGTRMGGGMLGHTPHEERCNTGLPPTYPHKCLRFTGRQSTPHTLDCWLKWNRLRLHEEQRHSNADQYQGAYSQNFLRVSAWGPGANVIKHFLSVIYGFS